MFDEPRRLPNALVAKIFALQPMHEWFVMRVLSRHLRAQSALPSARPAHFLCFYADLVTHAERHRPCALEVPGGNDRAPGVDDTIARLPRFGFLRRLTLCVPYEVGVLDVIRIGVGGGGVASHVKRRTLLAGILRDLVALERLSLQALNDSDDALDFSRLTALTRLEIDAAFRPDVAKTFPRSLRTFAFHGSRVVRDAFPEIAYVTTLEITKTSATMAVAVAECAPTLTDLTWGGAGYSHLSLKHLEQLRNLRRLRVRGVVDDRDGPCATKVDGVAPSVGDIRATFGRWARLPALERLDLSDVVVYCSSESDASRERATFESLSDVCADIESPQWVGGVSCSDVDVCT